MDMCRRSAGVFYPPRRERIYKTFPRLPSLNHCTLPYPTLPYPTLPYLTLPTTLPYLLPYPTYYPTLPYPTLPYPALRGSCVTASLSMLCLHLCILLCILPHRGASLSTSMPKRENAWRTWTRYLTSWTWTTTTLSISMSSSR